MRFDLKPVSLNRIDVADERYRISIPDTIDSLIQSVRCMGLINLPVLLPAGDRYIIICGFKRISACLSLGWTQVDCRILDADTPPAMCLQMAVAENAGSRALTVLEQAIAVQKLSSHYPDDRQLRVVLEPLGLVLNPALIDKYRRLRALPGVVQSCVSSDRLSLTLALDLETVGKTAALAVAGLFETLRPTVNQQKEIFTNLKDIARSEDIAIEDLIGSPFIHDLVHQSDMDRKQVIQLLRKRLRHRRYPVLSAAEEVFDACVRELNLPEDAQLIPPKDFEDIRYRFVLSFERPGDLLRHADRLAALSDHRLLQSMLNRNLADS